MDNNELLKYYLDEPELLRKFLENIELETVEHDLLIKAIKAIVTCKQFKFDKPTKRGRPEDTFDLRLSMQFACMLKALISNESFTKTWRKYTSTTPPKKVPGTFTKETLTGRLRNGYKLKNANEFRAVKIFDLDLYFEQLENKSKENHDK